MTHVAFGYFDEPGGSRRGLEIVNARPDQRSWVRPVRQEDVGVWWDDRVPDDDVENFAARFISREDHASMQGEHGFLDVGPIRVAAIVELEAVGRYVQAQRREFRRLPSLRSIGFELPQTRVTLLGWKLSFEQLEDHARALEQLQLGTDLFRALEAAEARTGGRFRERERHHQGGG